MTQTATVDLSHLLLILAKTEYARADAICDGCVDDVLLTKTDAPRGRISVEDLADLSGAAVSLEDRERAACSAALHPGIETKARGGLYSSRKWPS